MQMAKVMFRGEVSDTGARLIVWDRQWKDSRRTPEGRETKEYHKKTSKTKIVIRARKGRKWGDGVELNWYGNCWKKW